MTVLLTHQLAITENAIKFAALFKTCILNAVTEYVKQELPLCPSDWEKAQNSRFILSMTAHYSKIKEQRADCLFFTETEPFCSSNEFGYYLQDTIFGEMSFEEIIDTYPQLKNICQQNEVLEMHFRIKNSEVELDFEKVVLLT